MLKWTGPPGDWKALITAAASLCSNCSTCEIDPAIIPTAKTGSEQANVYRQLFFLMTFFSIGAVSNFRKLWEEGIGKLAAVYVVSLFGFVIWVGLLISWFFFHGVKPPIVTG